MTNQTTTIQKSNVSDILTKLINALALWGIVEVKTALHLRDCRDWAIKIYKFCLRNIIEILQFFYENYKKKL